MRTTIDASSAAGKLRAAFVAAAVAWAALLVAVPWLASRDHTSTPASVLIIAVYAIGGFVCHQLPERSYHLWTSQMPVCARCAGIYAGAVVGAVVGVIRTAGAVRHKWTTVAQGFSPASHPRITLALAIAPTLATLLSEWATGIMPSHGIRAAAGVAIGLGVSWLVVAAADNQVN